VLKASNYNVNIAKNIHTIGAHSGATRGHKSGAKRENNGSLSRTKEGEHKWEKVRRGMPCHERELGQGRNATKWQRAKS
jgi:hypothetical protein